MTAISKAITEAEGPTALARKLTELNPSSPVSPQRVTNWRARGRVPSAFAIPVEAVSGVSRHELRPDIYPTDAAGSIGSSMGHEVGTSALEQQESA